MIKEVLAPHLGRKVKLGRKRPVWGPKLRLRRYLDHLVLPTPPATCDFSSKAMGSLSNLYLNDQYGDCVIAAGYHIVGVETGNADGSKPFIATDQEIVADYSAIGGFDPNNPNATDNGCDEQTALNYWTNHGFADGTQILGWLAVDATNKEEIQQAMFLFENLLFGLELPDSWIDPFPSANGFVWNVGASDPSNGHAVCGVGYNSKGVQIDTWGLLGTMTWEAIRALCVPKEGGELYVLLTPDQVAKGQQTAPNGVAWADLLTDFREMGGTQPAPAPPPGPGPAPVGGVTLAQAQLWANQGLANNWPVQGRPRSRGQR